MLSRAVALFLCLCLAVIILQFKPVLTFADTTKYAVATHRYMLDDNTGYDFSGKSETDSCFSNYKNFISLSMNGNGVSKKSYSSNLAYAVPYWNDSAYLEISPVSANWKTDMDLGTAKRSDGTQCSWKVSNDTYQFTSTSDGEKHTVQNGLLVMETSDDGNTWQKYQMINFPAGQTTHKWNLSSDMLISGKYLRISFMFEAYTTWKTGWWIFSSSHTEYKNIIEVSDPFFVCVNGFGTDDFGVATIKNLSEENITTESIEGFTTEEIKSASTLTNNSLTITGFEVDSNFPSYKIAVSKNGGSYKTVCSGYTVEEDGKYSIRLTSKFGECKSLTVYVQRQNITQTYFGKPFSNDPEETAFIQGNRILSGTNETLEDYGISLAYDWAKVPVYEKGATYNIKSSDTIIPISGYIIGECPEGDIEIDISTETGEASGVLDRPGYYTSVLSTINSVGDKYTLCFNWWIVDSNPGAQINKQLINYKSQEVYDLKPVYYSVVQERGPYTYTYKGQTIEKAGQMVFAFADYKQALQLALRIEKQYAQRDKTDSNVFYYRHADNPNLPLNEFELYRQMLEKAKQNVEINYFSHSNEYTLRGLGTDEIITDDGYLILADNPNDPITAPIVALDLAERAALTIRNNIVNNYSFISASPLDSMSVVLKNKDTGESYYIEYDKKVEEQLIEKNAVSGIYRVCETNIFGIKTYYDVKFFNPREDNDITFNLKLSTVEKTISAKNSGETYVTKSFVIENALSLLDAHGLILVTKGREQTPIDIYDLVTLSFEEKGEYSVHVEDRTGRSYDIKIIID